MYGAINQCLGGSASCVNVTDGLNRQLQQGCGDPNETAFQVDTTTFSIAANNAEARLYVTWKGSDQNYHARRIACYHLYDPRQYAEFRQCVHNIVDWGTSTRLVQIQTALDLLREQEEPSSSRAKRRKTPAFAGRHG
ncbi:hypothetical protein SPI_06488 [Niveomyces insectorum RCEF 264]|uniref:DUF7924 domain-containing protein n=1 Tax=Niveomyces insectorum RCEF 264 TaxID=1081102 RepID=A0A167RAJ5_9HYPO|nr:hypothetical protein SPI_06488 [Niveomyces insectorum RCEF 264]